MKKVLFLQIKGKSKAGVWFVNKTIGEELIKKGYDVTIMAIRNNPGDIKLEHDERMKLHTINPVDLWEISRKKDIKSIKSFIKYIKEHKKLKQDYEKAKEYIRNLDPDYIIASHYQCLDFVPKEYYSKTLHEQHSSMSDVYSKKANLRTLKKYNNKIFGMIWLSKATKKEAEKIGFKNNHCIYNPVRFNFSDKADVVNNKKLTTITRINNTEKRINIMIEIVNDILSKNPDWTFELYGSGYMDDKTKEIIATNPQIKYLGSTDIAYEKLLSSSINLNTSIYEGFSLSILEASMCGLPTVSFNFGESVFEEIIDDKTGYIVKQNDIEEYKNKLNYLMNNPKKLEEMSKNNKEFSKQFVVDNVINDWIQLFNKIDKQQ